MKLTDKQRSEIAVFSPLVEGLVIQMNKVLSGEDTSVDVTFFGTGYSPDPYVQVGLPAENGDFTLEVVSHRFLETKLQDHQIRFLLDNGWNKPGSENPNFWMRVDSKDLYEAARIMVFAAVKVFGLLPNTWFTFGMAPSEREMNPGGLFWRKRGSTGVICLPGQNLDRILEVAI
jgi:hypothetical protein